MYDNGKLKLPVALRFLNRISVPYFEAGKLIKDILFLQKDGTRGYFGWDRWDYMERKSGKVYTPPDPYYWLAFGFFVDQIKDSRLFINPAELSEEELTQAKYLYDRLKDNYDYLFNNFDKWTSVLNLQTKKELNLRANNILNLFASLKQKNLLEVDSAVASAPIDEAKVRAFQEVIGKAWKSQARIHALFKQEDNAELIEDENIKLKIIGNRTFFEKAKMMFIDGQHSQTIYGMDRMGGDVGRWEDNEFFSTILKGGGEKVAGINMLEALDLALSSLRAKGENPTMILMEPEYSYKDNAFLESKRFVSKLNVPEENLPFFLLGTFDEIPIYTSFSPLLKGKVVVCDFKKAFKMRYKKALNGFEDELVVNVREVTQQQAEERLNENSVKWKRTETGELKDEDAITVIKTSINLDIWVVADFKVVNPNSYVVGYIKSGGTQ
ncbi:MAG TPA: hypothetical protein VG603_00440 [Chitinophagales bacterium]|nr:hypothetical protein [Chitinophagales bacterium]